jgi:4-amino-4-deoxy-L-arabinose transferase-like glycosyltransferase
MGKTQLENTSAAELLGWMRKPFHIVLAAFISRAAVVGVMLANNTFEWGKNEPAAIARGIIERHAFCCAFHGASGPTAWLAPIYPALLACFFRLFGVASTTSAEVAILINILFASLTAVVLLQFGKEQFGDTAGLIAAWAWALSPALLYIPWLPWETSLSGFVLISALLLTLRLNRSTASRNWIVAGLIWGIAALLNPALVAPLPFLTFTAGYRSGRYRRSLAMLLACTFLVLPWTARNYLAFHHFVPIRSNFWPEAYFGNVTFSLHPTGDSMLYQKEGEIQFAADLRKRTLNAVSSDFPEFRKKTLQRIVKFWTLPRRLWPYSLILVLFTVAGIIRAALRRKLWIDFALVLLSYPLIYYFTYTFARYRYPIEPLMYALAGYAASEMLSITRRYMGVSRARRA